VLDAIRDGRLDTVFDKRDTPESLAAIKELDVQWLNAGSVHSERHLQMRLRVTDGGSGVEGAKLTVRFARTDAAPFYTQVITGANGEAEMSIDVDESALPDAAVLVQASHTGRTATRKFQLRKVEA
jgi:redox-sensitive bicupin YhaK (pirin superfamily)